MWFLRFVMASGIPAGLLFTVVGGLAVVAGGQWQLWFVPVFGATLALLSVLMLIDVTRFRGEPPAAIAADGGVRLPLRPGFFGRRVTIIAVVGGWGAPLSPVIGQPVLLALAWLWTLVLLGYAGWTWRRGPGPYSITVDPDGLTVPRSRIGASYARWRDIRDIQVVPGASPGVLWALDGGGASGVMMIQQAWQPDDVAALIARAKKDTTFRAALADPAAVDAWRRSEAARG